MEFRTDDKMYIVDANTSVASNVRDAVEFSPALIVDGKALIDEQSGFRSIQPRTVIAQAKGRRCYDARYRGPFGRPLT